jgi:hypothetical protein
VRSEASYGNPRRHQFVGGPQRGRHGRGVEFGQRPLGLIEAPDQVEAPDREIPRMRGVDVVAVLFEDRSCRVERRRGPTQVARNQRNLGLGNDTSRTGNRLFRTERADRPSQERLGSDEIAELCHRDAAERERRRVLAQGHTLQGAERVTCSERTRRGRDQRVHRNPATLVTPTIRCPALTIFHDSAHREDLTSDEEPDQRRRHER